MSLSSGKRQGLVLREPMAVLNVDLSEIPQNLQGRWVVFRASKGSPLGSGETPLDALHDAHVQASDPDILLVLVPTPETPISA